MRLLINEFNSSSLFIILTSILFSLSQFKYSLTADNSKSCLILLFPECWSKFKYKKFDFSNFLTEIHHKLVIMIY